MIGRYVATFALMLHAAVGWAAKVTPSLDGGQMSVLIESTAWPDTLRKDLASGLTNRILIRVTLARGAEIVRKRAVEVAVRYDLWEEQFVMSLTLDGVKAAALSLKGLDETQEVLRQLRLPRLFATTGMTATQPHTITTEVLLNPVDRERMEKISKWVAENSIAPADIGGRNTGGVAVTIFNRIFEEYAKGADIAAIWRETSTSRPFRLEELADESR